jgi:hypothetical protein
VKARALMGGEELNFTYKGSTPPSGATSPCYRWLKGAYVTRRPVVKLRIVFIPRALALSWAGFWIFFFVAESWAWRTPAHVMASWVGVGLLFVFLALLPWRWELTGGLLLVVVGLSIGVAYAIWAPPLPLASRVITTVVLSGPPLVAGILFLMHYRAVAARSDRPPVVI